MEPLTVETSGGVANVILNKPDVRNAFDALQIDRLTGVFREMDASVVVLSGNGKVFSAGGDLNWMKSTIGYSEAENLMDARKLAGLFEAIDECPCPVVAKVHGAAFGGGLGLVSVCDIVIAAEATKFCFSEVKLGLVPSVISRFAIRKIGEAQARRYFLTAEVFDAARAKEIGLVHEVTPPDGLAAVTQSIVSSLLENGPNALRSAKKLMRDIRFVNDEEANSLSTKTIASARVSGEGQEGVIAFLEKRKPNWQD